MKNDELKSCPFCDRRYYSVDKNGIGCVPCNYRLERKLGETERQMRNRWNTRTKQKEQDVCPDGSNE